MTEEDFWRIIHDSREEAGGTQTGQIEKLTEKLELLNEDELTSFTCHSFLVSTKLNIWKVVGAFHIIYRDFSFSEDLFRDFISAIIMQGESAVKSAIVEPDLIKADQLEACEAFLSCPSKAWAKQNPLRKFDFLPDLPSLTGQRWNSEPAGPKLDTLDIRELGKIYPRLWDQFGINPKRPPNL